MKQVVTLKVNGVEHTLAVSPQTTLLSVLRQELGLTGTKCSCNSGDCGACTVIIDGVAVNSCLRLAVGCQGKEITTIEGLAKDGKLHPLQKAFIYHGAVQCGFCTPGQIMSARALIDRNPEPSDIEIKEALGGNICRCTGYAKIIEAVRNWKQYINSDEPPVHDYDLNKYQVVGKSLPRVDAFDKVTGRTKFVDDYSFPGMLYGKILTSPIPHGRIKSIDTSEAEKLPGVMAVITGKNVTDRKYGVSPPRYDESVLAKDKVRYVGDEVAAVAAVDEATAAKACQLIKVEYEELPAVFSAYEAAQPGAPLVHENYPNNINTAAHHEFGSVAKGFAEADYIREEMFVGNHVSQSPMEPHSAIAYWEGDGRLVLYSSNQQQHYLQYHIANVFDIPIASIKVMVPAVGGGFGGKGEVTPLDLCASILSKKTGRPVKMIYTRPEVFHHHRGRHKQHMKFKLGMKKDGRITACQSEIYLDGGAYTSYGIVTVYYAGSMIALPYKLPNYKYDGYRMMTNKPACGPMRGHGCPQPRFAFESLLSMMAEDLGLDPIDVRLVNALEPNTRTINDLDVRSCEFKATLRQVREKAEWGRKYRKLPPGKGIGIGCGGFVSGAGYAIYRGSVQRASESKLSSFEKKSIFPHSNAIIRVTEDGTAAILMTGTVDIGQGALTVLTQMAAEAMGIPAQRVRIRSEDSDICPLELGAYSSRVTLMGGNAVMRAGLDIKKKLLPIAAQILKCQVEALDVKSSKIFLRSNPDSHVLWDECARLYFNDNGPLVGTGWYKPPEGMGGDYRGAAIGTSPAYTFASSICELSVDLKTGKVSIDKFTDFHDCGTPINPMSVHGQVEGAIVMGASETIMENMEFDEKGRIVNPNLHDYLIMTIKDAPEIFSGIVDSYEPEGPYGAKEAGEGATLPVLAAIAHAIKGATGIWFKELPITPEKILKALKEKAQ